MKLAASIREFGFTVPVLVDQTDVIVAGEARWRAACDLELDAVPVIRIEHLTPAQVRAYRIADNRLADLSTFDDAALASELQAIIDEGEVEIEVTGFEVGEVDVLIEGTDAADTPTDDPADAVPPLAPAVSRAGDLWQLGAHRLICGSCRDAEIWERLMQGQKARMMFEDPPFNVKINGHVSSTGRHAEFHEATGEMTVAEFTGFLIDALGAAIAHLQDGGIAEICMDFRHLPELFEAVRNIGLSVLNLCVWNKMTGAMGSLYRAQHELVLITKKGKAPHTNNVQLGRHGRYRTNVWDYPGANRFSKTRADDLAAHPTVKPIALVADAIRDVTAPGEIVIDGFMGSGTTLLAAERSKRIGYGVEIEGGYVDVAIRRWEKMTGKQAVLVETGETLAQVTARRQQEAATEPEPAVPAPSSSSPASPAPVRHRARRVAA